jgi:glutamine synthetase
MAAVVAPTINSYKRLVPGYEAPVYVGWAQINRSALIRIPRYIPGKKNAVRAELRCPDPSANPYLAITVMLAAGLDGIDRGLNCRSDLNDVNIYLLTQEERKSQDISELPGSLAEAIRELEANQVLIGALGREMYESFLRAKWAEVEEYRLKVSDWEVERYLETA